MVGASYAMAAIIPCANVDGRDAVAKNGVPGAEGSCGNAYEYGAVYRVSVYYQ